MSDNTPPQAQATAVDPASLARQFNPGRPVPPPADPALPEFTAAELLDAVRDAFPEHTDHKDAGGGHFTASNAAGQTVVIPHDVARKVAAHLYGA